MLGERTAHEIEQEKEDSINYERSWSYSIKMHNQKRKMMDLLGYGLLSLVLSALMVMPGYKGSSWAVVLGVLYLVIAVVFAKWYVEASSMRAMYRAACIAWGKPGEERRYRRSYTDEEFMRHR